MVTRITSTRPGGQGWTTCPERYMRGRRTESAPRRSRGCARGVHQFKAGSGDGDPVHLHAPGAQGVWRIVRKAAEVQR
eukprot:3673387-Lingulodinium_polyedra.AAC.1